MLSFQQILVHRQLSGSVGIQQATKVSFLMLVYIIKHSEKKKKSVQSVRGCE